MAALVRIVMVLVLLVALAVWAVVGFIFWIPLLIRATSVFSTSLVHSAITNQKPSNLGAGLEAAAGFYFNGFKSAFSTFSGDSNQTTSNKEIRLGAMFLEILWAAFSWVLILSFSLPGFGRHVVDLISEAFRIGLR